MSGSQSKPLVFISYRNKAEPGGDPGGRRDADILRYKLEKILGADSVFHDYRDIKSGKSWQAVLTEQLGSCQLLIALVHSSWWFRAREEDEFGGVTRLLEKEDDWVRKEIDTALTNNIPILPIVLEGRKVKWPKPKEFNKAGPKDLHPFFELQAWKLDLYLPEDGARVLLENKLRTDYRDLFHGKAPSSPPSVVSTPTQHFFGLHHQYTCDRSNQYEQFLEHHYDYVSSGRNAFFFIHGGNQQAHSGLFKRFVSVLRGIDDPSVNKEVGINSVLAVERKLKVKSRKVLEMYLPHQILSALDIPDAEIDSHVREKDLAFAVEKSKMLRDPGGPDKVAFLLTIHENYWDSKHTRELLLWFIEEFCLEKYQPGNKEKGARKKLLQSGPDFYFFFAVEYKGEGKRVKKEIEKSLQKQKTRYTIVLPELDMVRKVDIENWFEDYDEQWPIKRDRDAIFQSHFGSHPPEMYMEEVQYYLGQIINQINERAKYAKRTH